MYFNFTELNGANKTIRLDNAGRFYHLLLLYIATLNLDSLEDYDDLADEKTLLITTRKVRCLMKYRCYFLCGHN